MNRRKRIFSIIILLLQMMCFILCSCASTDKAKTTGADSTTADSGDSGDAETAVQAEPETWTLQKTVDDFGDVTEDSKTVIAAEFEGTFSNTATNDSELKGAIGFQQKENSEHYIAAFSLLEYGDHNATYVDGDAKTLKVKVDDQITEIPLKGESPNGQLCAGLDDYEYSGDWLLDTLYAGVDLRCIIEIGSSQYNFIIPSDNLPQLMIKEGIEAPPADMTIQEALRVYLNLMDDKEGMRYGPDFFMRHMDDYPVITTSEMEREIIGSYLEIQIDTFAPYWWMFNYEGNKRFQTAYIKTDMVDLHHYSDTSDLRPKEFSLHDNLLECYTGKESTKIYQVRRISDCIYIRYAADDSGQYTIPDYLMFSYNDPIKNDSDLSSMIDYITATLVPQA